MITLREYQKEPIKKAIRYFRSNVEDPCLIVLPTAWGKSILTAFAAKYINPEDKLLVVQPSKELLEQNYKKYISLCEDMESAGIYSASFGKKQVERITYATIGSIKEIGTQFKELGFTKMLIDEAHLYPRKEQSMLGQFLKDSGIKQVLGITATPLKLEQFSEKQGERFDKWSQLIMLTNPSPSGDFFKYILHVGQIQEMIDLHYWTPLIYERIPFDPSELRFNTSGSEYSKDSEEKAYILNNIRANIFAALDYHISRKHCVVFVPSVEEAQVLTGCYPDSAYVSGDMNKKERERIIRLFRAGEIRVVFNVSVLSTGFDYPEIDMLLLAFTTASVAKYYQILGRGVRIHPGKKDCLVVDMGGNVDRFGKVEDIYFEHSDRWRMYGSREMLLTGLPIGCIGKITKNDIQRIYAKPIENKCLDFGKHKGKTVNEIPMSYKKWYLTSPGNKNYNLLDQIVASIENNVRDTTEEDMPDTMPDGQYAGMSIGLVPRGYLAWYYNSRSWNKCNDSLRRAIEYYYGGIPPYFVKTDKKKTTTEF